jgi:hypothetical protein
MELDASRTHADALDTAAERGAAQVVADGGLFVVCPEPQNLYNAFALEYLIDNSVLDADSTGIGPIQIADELFEGRRTLKGILC